MNDLGRSSVPVQGRVAPGFERVRQAFAANFTRGDDYEEIGAAVTVYRAGQPVVNLWAGHADGVRQQPWREDTLVNVYSTSKGITALAVALLVQDGRLGYDDAVVKHWPEFGAAGKDTITVAQLLAHQAGLPGFAAPTAPDDLYDWTARCAALARQAPMWAPGTKASYHAMTWGFLAGELVRRASGMSVGKFIAGRIAGPLGADVYMGLPQALEPRVAQMLRPRNPPDLSGIPFPPEALAALVNPQLDGEICNARAWRAAELPAVNVQASAHGLARIYGAVANGGALNGATLFAPDTISRMTRIQRGGTDLLLGFTDNWAMGFCFNQQGMLGPSPDTFGHGGWGGSIGCANLEAGVGMGYVCNQMGAQLVGDPRATGLCQAIWECL